MNTILKNTISITVITLVAGLALGVVQDITAGPIATQAEKSKEEAYKAVFEDASSFSEYSLDDTNQAEDLVAYLNDNGFTAQTIAMTNGVNAGLCAFRYVEGGAES